MKWIEEIRAHFAVRRPLSPAELAIEFARGGEPDAQEVLRCLEIFHAEYEFKPGLLRASDSMRIFTDAPKANPLTWIWVRAAYEDRMGELSYRLDKERWRRGLEVSGAQDHRRVRLPLPRDGAGRANSEPRAHRARLMDFALTQRPDAGVPAPGS